MEDCNCRDSRDLLRSAKDGSADALAALLTAYAPLIESQVLALQNNDTDSDERDDLRQEAALALCSAVEHYDEAQSVSFGAFAKVCIHNRLISYQRKKLRRPPTVSLEQYADPAPEKEDPLQHLVEKDDFLALCRRIEETLSPYENRIWWLYVSGSTAAEIARSIERDERSVQNAIYRIRKKLRLTLPHQ